MEHWTGALELKAVDGGQRIITAYAAVAGNLDRTGDVIAPGAFTKTLQEKQPGDVAVLIGHRQDTLPVGIPLSLKADSRGLLTETYIFPGPQGDQLLETAKALLRHGQTLGVSIGYHARGHRYGPGPDGKQVRHLTDIDLVEYSYAARQTIANPEALVVGVKVADPALETKPAPHMHMCRLVPPSEFQAGSFRTLERDHQGRTYQVIMGRLQGQDTMTDQALHYPTAEGWDAAAARAHCESHGGQEFAAATGEGGKQMDDDAGAVATKATWDTAYVNNLPNSSFLYVEPGEDDDEGKRVPRSKRHFPVKSAEGGYDAAHVRNAIARIPQSDAPGLSAEGKRALQAKARRILDSLGGSKQLPDGPAWQAGAVPDLTWAGYALLGLAEQVEAAQCAWGLLGEDTKQGQRVPAPDCATLADIVQVLARVGSDARTVAEGQEGRAEMRGREADLDALALTVRLV